MRTPTAGSMWLMRLTWAGVLVFPLPLYALLFRVVCAGLAESGDESAVPWVAVDTFGVGWGVAALVAVALATAWGLPRVFHRRALERLRRRAREEVDPLSIVAYRTAPPRIAQFPAAGGALEAARARFAGRSAATLAMVAVVDLAILFWMTPRRSFCCWGCEVPETVYLPSPRAWGALIALVVAFTLLQVPTRGKLVGPLRDLLGPG